MEYKSNHEDEMEDGGGMTPIDDLIARVESYIKDRSLVTPETLTQLRDDLMELKTVVDDEDEPMDEEGEDEGNLKKRGLSIMLMFGKKKGGKHDEMA